MRSTQVAPAGPAIRDTFQDVTFDHVGSGRSDLSAYDPKKYNTLAGYADDLIEILDEIAGGPVIFVGHSVNAMIGLVAGVKAPDKFAAHIMIGPSPCYIYDGDYVGGFTREDIDGLLDMLESNYLGWASSMAPAIMGAPQQPELSIELVDSFCRTDPEIAKHFARVTFLSDNRADVARLDAPALIIQSAEDIIAPATVGEFLQRTLPNGILRVVDNVGHCPHLSAPCESATAMDEFLARLDY